ncbi:MAG: DUF58 domain-containing protein [Lentisphaeria bacterium]|nr:MAG: DUF58 domain-containing protein [Lentisphaeria bacterium]
MKREAASGFTYLPARTLESLKGIELVARSLVEGALLGLHRSPYHGFSSEFAGDRKYAPGDSIRYLDWKALARSGKYYIKEFEEESNLKSYILLDGSGSMAMSDPAGHPVKFHYACYLAAAFCYLMYQQRDASGLFVYSDRILRASPARAGRANLTALLGTLESLKPEGGDPQRCLSAADRRTAAAPFARDSLFRPLLARRGFCSGTAAAPVQAVRGDPLSGAQRRGTHLPLSRAGGAPGSRNRAAAGAGGGAGPRRLPQAARGTQPQAPESLRFDEFHV